MNEPITYRPLPLGLFPDRPQPRLYDRIVEVLRTKHYSRRTEEAYVHWIRRYILFHQRTHPRQLAESDVNRFLTHLAVKQDVAASTQNQALAALLFLYEHVLEKPLNRIEGVVRARKPRRLPVVMTREEVEAVLAELQGEAQLVCTLPGLRLQDGLRLRVKDLDFGRGEILIRNGKGDVDRVTMLPETACDALQEHLRRISEQHQADLRAGRGRAPLPHALAWIPTERPRANGWIWTPSPPPAVFGQSIPYSVKDSWKP